MSSVSSEVRREMSRVSSDAQIICSVSSVGAESQQILSVQDSMKGTEWFEDSKLNWYSDVQLPRAAQKPKNEPTSNVV